MESGRPTNPFSLVVVDNPPGPKKSHKEETLEAMFSTKEMGDSRKHLRKRVWAFSTDLITILVLHKLTQLSYVYFIANYFMSFDLVLKKHLTANLGAIDTFSTFVIFWSYFLSSYYLFGGRSVGKVIFGVKVQSMHNPDSEQLTFQEVFMRVWGYFFCFQFLYLPFLASFLRRDQRGLPDWMSKTHIVDEKDWQAHHKAVKKEEDKKKKKKHDKDDVIITPPPEEESSQMELFEMSGS